MKRMYLKLIAIVMALVLSASIVVMSSYAWLVLSSSPELEGIQITIAGGSTIMVAADLTAEVNGVTYHYPDSFDGTLNFSRHESYSYLRELGALTPVSTADGLNWFIADYYDLDDPLVQDGEVLTGTLKPLDEYILDTSLSYANLSSLEEEKLSYGNYYYLDFWVVSPGADYTLRISTGDDSNGSFVMGLQQVAAGEDGGYTLVDAASTAAESVRVGFLVNTETASEANYAAYQSSDGYAAHYESLRGNFDADPAAYQFTIYEPNGDTHTSSGAVEEGAYDATYPIGLFGDRRLYTDIRDRLTVQRAGLWAAAQTGSGTGIEQQFQTAAAGNAMQGLSLEEMADEFYLEFLEGQIGTYVQTGQFVKNTGSLYDAAEGDLVSAETLSALPQAGATDDVWIVQLKQNVPQRVRMFIWLEGEDVDCVNNVMATSFAFSIELAGSNQD